jgi:hypothetical protein
VELKFSESLPGAMIQMPDCGECNDGHKFQISHGKEVIE